MSLGKNPFAVIIIIIVKKKNSNAIPVTGLGGL
jgi:hypothetical protein